MTEVPNLRRSTRVAESQQKKREAEDIATPETKKSKTSLSEGEQLPKGIILKDQDDNDIDISAVVESSPTVVIFGELNITNCDISIIYTHTDTHTHIHLVSLYTQIHPVFIQTIFCVFFFFFFTHY